MRCLLVAVGLLILVWLGGAAVSVWVTDGGGADWMFNLAGVILRRVLVAALGGGEDGAGE